jgi:acyl carrier protein
MSPAVPQGIEVLVRKAAVDPSFKMLLLERRAAAAAEIGLELTQPEAIMLSAVTGEQLSATIARTTVPLEHRRAFLGQAAAAMLAALGAMATAAGTASAGGSSLSKGGGWGAGGCRADDVPRLPKKKPPEKTGTVEERVVDILAKRFKIGKEQIKHETSLAADLGADRERLFAIKSQLEKEFDLKIPFKDFEALLTVGQIVDYVEKHTKKTGEAPVGEPKPPDRIPVTDGIRPDRPPVSRGIRPDRPKPKEEKPNEN